MDCEGVRTAATVVAALGTVGAVVYALYRDLILANRRRPRLDLLFDPTGVADQVIVGTAGGGTAAYVRLRVANEKGKDSADEVQVIVTDVRPQDGSQEPTPVGLPLVWVGSLPPVTEASVHPGVERYIDLTHANWPAPADELAVAEKYTGTTPLELDVYPKPAGGQHILFAGKYAVRLEIVARNADATAYEIALEWDGVWLGKTKMWQALRVQPPKRI